MNLGRLSPYPQSTFATGFQEFAENAKEESVSFKGGAICYLLQMEIEDWDVPLKKIKTESETCGEGGVNLGGDQSLG